VVLGQSDVIAALLERCKLTAEKKLSIALQRRVSCSSAVIAIPAFASEFYRRVVLQAAAIAGFHSTRLIAQSTAAAMAYRLDRVNNYSAASNGSANGEEESSVGGPTEEYVATLAMGARSLEVAVFRVEPDLSMQLVASRGMSTLGGQEFTDAMAALVLDEIYKQRTTSLVDNGECRGVWEVEKAVEVKSDIEWGEEGELVMAVWHACEKAKKMLADLETVTWV